MDASIAVKWAIEEADRAAAVGVLAAGESIAAPDLIWSEIANVFRTKVRGNEISVVQAKEGLSFIRDAIGLNIPTRGLAERALSLALLLNHAVYDCIYLACALDEGAVLVTADTKFCAKCRLAGAAGLIQSADEWLRRAFALSEQSLAEIARVLLPRDQG